ARLLSPGRASAEGVGGPWLRPGRAGLSSCGGSVFRRRPAERKVGPDRREQGGRDERDRHACRYALPVPLRVQAQQIARRRVEQEVALRKENLVEEQEQLVKGEHRADTGGDDKRRCEQPAITHEPQRIAIADRKSVV